MRVAIDWARREDFLNVGGHLHHACDPDAAGAESDAPHFEFRKRFGGGGNRRRRLKTIVVPLYSRLGRRQQ
jgi:hypothetical protein